MFKVKEIFLCALSIAFSAAFQPCPLLPLKTWPSTTSERKKYISCNKIGGYEYKGAIPALFQKRFRKQSAHNIMFMATNEVQQIPVLARLSNRSLASSFVISIEDNNVLKGSFTWNCYPIDEVIAGERFDGGVGEQAIGAMNSNLESAEKKGGFKLKCSITDTGAMVETDAKDNGALVTTLSRVMLQSVFEKLSGLDDITIIVPSVGNPSIPSSEIYLRQDLMSRSGYAPLFASILPPDIDWGKIEMSDMVNGDGNPIGYIPRPLVHKFNLLHRGIGIVVCRDAHLTKSCQDQMLPEVYVHQRTDTKRIFPSLYDMFVGGVATAGEDLKLTAAREVGEELGLTRPSLSDELFKCTVCTSYNRCVVTMYTYKFDSGVDSISWQEEEVQWGDFVPYSTIEKSAALSIERLRQSKNWPGADGDALEDLMCHSVAVNEESVAGDQFNWDYVPDGLLVWMAWIQWISR
jgi:8-oxo-dGTP pyrophosphatase MutT (NUDIX family)